MEDKEIRCQDCQARFLFTVNDQEFYKSNNFTDPKRCKSCRAKRKANRA